MGQVRAIRLPSASDACRHFREHELAPVHHPSFKMASVVEITPKFGLKPEKKGPSTGTLVATDWAATSAAVGARVGRGEGLGEAGTGRAAARPTTAI